jgi:hypothetical protein
MKNINHEDIKNTKGYVPVFVHFVHFLLSW